MMNRREKVVFMLPQSVSANQKYINAFCPTAFKSFTDELYNMISEGIKKKQGPLVFVCIGTDRSTGDSLGPLTGHKIGNPGYNNVHIYGNLENPVHAQNIIEVMDNIQKTHENPFIVAIDACLGQPDRIGYLSLGTGPVKPGAGISRDLPPVGDIHINGIVNIDGLMNFLILQNTRLCVVMKMADLISSGIRFVLWKINRDFSEANRDFSG